MQIHELSLFHDVDMREAVRMMRCLGAREQRFLSGEVVLNFGQGRRTVGIVRDGRAMLVRIDINGNRTMLESLGEDSLFGEALAFSGLPGDSLFIVCEETCDVVFIDYEHITKRCANACECHAKLLENMFRMISLKTLLLSERIEVISNRSIRDKLLCYFALLSSEAKNGTFELPFTITALAEYICADRSAMSRELNRMKKEGLIAIDKRRVTLINPYPST